MLLILVSIAAYTDIRRDKVHNALTFPAIALGLVLNGAFRGADGLSDSIRAGMLAFALLIIPVALKGVGAGDLKLLVAVGALEGVEFLITAFFWSALIVGAVSAAILGYRRLAYVAFPMYSEWRLGKIKALPFAVAVALGCLLALYAR